MIEFFTKSSGILKTSVQGLGISIEDFAKGVNDTSKAISNNALKLREEQAKLQEALNKSINRNSNRNNGFSAGAGGGSTIDLPALNPVGIITEIGKGVYEAIRSNAVNSLPSNSSANAGFLGSILTRAYGPGLNRYINGVPINYQNNPNLYSAGQYFPGENRIDINTRYDMQTQMRALVHEVGHALDDAFDGLMNETFFTEGFKPFTNAVNQFGPRNLQEAQRLGLNSDSIRPTELFAASIEALAGLNDQFGNNFPKVVEAAKQIARVLLLWSWRILFFPFLKVQ